MKLTESEVREAVKHISYNKMTAYAIAEAVQDALIKKIKANGAVGTIKSAAFHHVAVDWNKLPPELGTKLYAIGKEE